ncbi:hypothetical protein SKAU_G00283010 [Synaphobranchus kaupii]|uniref:USP domain-containing protein n=1 Tax=Synaphobranchus kaupii TaxID=118154 RepID=A0A9Q1IP49_SYNKA|nr:hypothetical protein SKAU_G00283010 [Synaphobranchus kaupii]
MDHIDQEQEIKKKKKWFLKKGKKGTKATSESLTEPVQTIDLAEQTLARNIDLAEQTPVLTINCAEKPALPIGCIEKPALSIDCTEQRLEFHSSRKIQEEHISQDEIRRSRIDHTVLGFPNIGNTCYMNATLQSLFSLQIFIQDIRREESCWRSNLSTHLLKCLADLHSARASCSRERKMSLLKTLK